VVRHISERLVKMGHDVTVAARKLPERKSLIHNGVKIVEFDVKSGSGFGMSSVHGLKGDTKKYQNFLRQGNFDIVMTYAAQQWTTDLMFDVLDEIKAKKVIVPCGYSALGSKEFEGYYEKMPGYLRKFDAAVYMCEDYRDINFAKKHRLKNSHFIPNGADETEFSKPLSSERKSELKKKYGLRGLIIMTIANYTGEKGHKELAHVFKRLPLPKATLISAGGMTPQPGPYFGYFINDVDRVNNSRKFPGKRIVLVDGVQRDEVRDLLKLADIFAFFSNIECSPLVLFESAAAGVPFVASAAGNSSEIAKWTGGGVIVKSDKMPYGRVAADLNDAILQISKLAYSPLRRRALGRTGRRNWEQKYTWEILAKKYEKLYLSLLG
jgi:glycosyltransferase involved in cell wall biosynthesis